MPSHCTPLEPLGPMVKLSVAFCQEAVLATGLLPPKRVISGGPKGRSADCCFSSKRIDLLTLSGFEKLD